jgi:hypothetical protein
MVQRLQHDNLACAGMTNRPDLLDEALTRPGRIELKIEIGLPDERGRLQILQIHTGPLAKNGFLAQDVQLPELAERTRNFTGTLQPSLCPLSALRYRRPAAHSCGSVAEGHVGFFRPSCARTGKPAQRSRPAWQEGARNGGNKAARSIRCVYATWGGSVEFPGRVMLSRRSCIAGGHAWGRPGGMMLL